MGMGATNIIGRVEASLGHANSVELVFNNSVDLSNGGILLALPALLSQGLLSGINDHFNLPKGYYPLCTLFLFLAFMTMCRIKFIESLKYEPPGEWGKLLGLDRTPEPRTLRKKIQHLSTHSNPVEWGFELSKKWMEDSPDETGFLYVDGHVRVYYGNQTKLPRHYVARDKLCARATCDYWVNAMEGKPFFYVNKAVDPGMLQVLEHEIIPRLEVDIPNQPTPEELKAKPLLPRFTIIYDREGYSPAFMARAWEKRIAVITYMKNQSEDWPKEEFSLQNAKLPSGGQIDLTLAERGTYLGKKIWVREIRRLRDKDVQGSIVSTNYDLNKIDLFVKIVSRWSQENFFAYARREYNLDRLIDYGIEPVSDTAKIINPKYRNKQSEIKKLASLLQKVKLKFSAITLEGEIDPKRVEEYTIKKAGLLEEIKTLETQVAASKLERKDIPRHILFHELSEEDKFHQLRVHGKHLIDTVKMIAYRAETAMASIIREKVPMHDSGVTRVLLREIYNNSIDLHVDREKKVLTVRLHHLANWSSDNAAKHLCEELTATETVYPGTDYRMVYELIS